ncbi:hypothetical protein BsWGS_06024 [Bradybaena similaris]
MLSICGMSHICFLKLSPYFFIGTLCQEIILGPSRLITPCTSKARSEVDRFEFNGTIGKDLPALIGEGWQSSMIVQAHHPGKEDPTQLCVLTLRGETCDAGADAICSCNYTVKQIHFVVNYPLNQSSSQALFLVIWSHDTIASKMVLSDKNFTLPEIFDVTTAKLTLTIDGVIELPTSNGSCSITLTLSKSNLMQLCCSDAAMPCYTQISLLGDVVANNESPCVFYSPTADGVSGILQLSYSVCAKTNYTQGTACIVKKGTVSRLTTQMTGITTAMNGATTTAIGTTTEPSFLNDNIVLIGAGSLLLLLLIIGGSVLLCCILKRRRQQVAASEPVEEPKTESIPPESLVQEVESEAAKEAEAPPPEEEIKEVGSNESAFAAEEPVAET